MSVKRVFMLNKPKWPWIVAGFIGSAANGVVMPLFALVFAEMMQLFFEPDIQTMRDDGIFFALMFLVVAVGAGLAQELMFGSFSVVGEHMSRRLRVMAFDAMLHKDMAFHDQEENSTGALATKLATDATLVNVRQALSSRQCAHAPGRPWPLSAPP